MVQLDDDNFVAFENESRGNDVNLTELFFYRKNITDIKPNLFNKFKLMKTLSLPENKLTEIPQGLFHHLSELETIDLSNNQFKTLDSDIFAFNKRLKIINLSNNKLESLPSGVFDNLPELEELHLEWNELTSFDFNSLKDSKKLKLLHLYSNSLYDIHNFDVHKTLWMNLKKIYLTNNKICSVQELRERSDHQIVELDQDNSERHKLCVEFELKKKLREAIQLIADRDALQAEVKQLMSALEEKNLKLEEVKRNLEEKAKTAAIEREALQEEKKQLVQEMEEQKTKCDEEKRDLLAKQEEQRKQIVERDALAKKRKKLSDERDAKMSHFQELVLKELRDRQKENLELNKKLDNLAIRVIVKQDIVRVTPENDDN